MGLLCYNVFPKKKLGAVSSLAVKKNDRWVWMCSTECPSSWIRGFIWEMIQRELTCPSVSDIQLWWNAAQHESFLCVLFQGEKRLGLHVACVNATEHEERKGRKVEEDPRAARFRTRRTSYPHSLSKQRSFTPKIPRTVHLACVDHLQTVQSGIKLPNC